MPQSVEGYLRLLASPDIVRARGDADGMGTRLVAHEATGTVIRIVSATDIPLDWLPDAIRSRVADLPVVERTETWSRDGDGAHTPLVFAFSGLPVEAHGSARVTPEGTRSRLDVDVTIRVDVPLLGSLVERAVAPRLGAALDAEAEFIASQPPAGTVTT